MIVVQELVYIALDTIYGFIFFADSSSMVSSEKDRSRHNMHF